MAFPSKATPAALRQTVLDYIQRQGTHLAVHTLTGRLSRDLGLSRHAIQQAIKMLLDQGRIAFTSRLGTSFIEPSYQGPVRLTPRLWIARPGQHPVLGRDEVAIYIASGDAFGDGRHPTTRLALDGLAQVITHWGGPRPAAGARCLDVGTGSGILALAALALGMDLAWGVDRDPCARSEAAANARTNGMALRLRISADLPQNSACKFQLITANLRLPTLCGLAPQWNRYRQENAWLVISGIRETEIDPLIRTYTPLNWQPIRKATEDGWAAVVFRYPPRNRSDSRLIPPGAITDSPKALAAAEG